MSVNLNVSKSGQSGEPEVYIFDKDEVIIGRSLKCDLQLKEAQNVVGREHTKLMRVHDSYKIMDLNSINFTFLNGRQLKAGIEYDLKSGDQIKICEYLIIVSFEKTETEQKTIISPELPNPFTKDAQLLAEILTRINKKYEAEDHSRNDQALQSALEKSLSPFAGDRIGELTAEILHAQKDTSIHPFKKSVIDTGEPKTIDRNRSLINILMEHLIKLVQAYRKFRVEFLGETDVKSFFYSCSVEELKKFVFDPSITSQESLKRLKQIEKVTDELMMHHIALLEGYKESINEGTSNILKRLNPDNLKKQLKGEKLVIGKLEVPYSVVPLLNIFKLVQLFSNIHNELSLEDQGIIEEKYFKRGYIKGYYKRMKHTDTTRNRQD